MAAVDDWVFGDEDPYEDEAGYDALIAYADRLARTRGRLDGEIADAETRLSWAAHERAAAAVLAPAFVRTLRILGVMNADDHPDHEARTLISRRRSQIDALDALQDYTQAAIEALSDPHDSPETAYM